MIMCEINNTHNSNNVDVNNMANGGARRKSGFLPVLYESQQIIWIYQLTEKLAYVYSI